MVKDRTDPNFPLLLQGARLYIVVRTDIPQLNPGKLGAQAGHAATQFVFDTLDKQVSETMQQMDNWRQQAGGGFGTKITLAATEAEIEEALPYLNTEFSLPTGIVVDPTYPMTNYFGDFFTREELTCGYVFAPTSTPAAALEYLKQFSLHP
jgi:peptidyl-tRNA hydrolase